MRTSILTALMLIILSLAGKYTTLDSFGQIMTDAGLFLSALYVIVTAGYHLFKLRQERKS